MSLTFGTTISGAEATLQTLEHLGVETMFGLPGGAVLPLYDPLLRSRIRHIHARHEQGAGHMAEGYARASGRTGVVVATSGPGATNLVTPLMNALMDSTPVLAITGQVATHVLGTMAFQEAPIVSITAAATKRNWQVTDPCRLVDTIAEAYRLASSGRPGPTLVDIPKDVLNATVEWSPPPPAADTTAPAPDDETIDRVCGAIGASRRPVLYVGGGALAAGDIIVEIAERVGIPIVTTLMGRGAVPDTHPMVLGMPGMHGLYAATTAIQRSDLLLAVGTRFDDRVTGDPSAFAPDAKVIHVDIDPAEIGKIRVPEIGIIGDARIVLGAILAGLPVGRRRTDIWTETVTHWKKEMVTHHGQRTDGPLKPQWVIERLAEAFGSETIVSSGVGQHQMWISQLWPFASPRHWLNSGGLGTMGFSIPAAVGAKAACPDRRVLAIDGDGCFQMTNQELTTAVAEGLPITVALVNNGSYGMVKQWQRLFYGGRLSSVVLGDGPDYLGLARAMGFEAVRATTTDEATTAIRRAVETPGPFLVEFVVDPTEQVWPMVVAGGSNDQVLMGPDDLGPIAHLDEG